MQKLALGSTSDVMAALKEIRTFPTQLPPSVTDCLNQNDELWTLGPIYGINKTSDVQKIESNFTVYLTLHYFNVHKWFGILNTSWKAGDFEKSGYFAANYSHDIWKPAKNTSKIVHKKLPTFTNK